MKMYCPKCKNHMGRLYYNGTCGKEKRKWVGLNMFYCSKCNQIQEIKMKFRKVR